MIAKFGLAGREVIVNGVLVSTCLYFLALWGRTSKGIKQVTSMIRNYFWSGSTDRARVGVAWEVCCFDWIAGRLNFIDPKDAARALLTKWVVFAC